MTSNGHTSPLTSTNRPPSFASPVRRPTAPRIPLPTAILHAHAFHALTSPPSEARFQRASSYFAIPLETPATPALTDDSAVPDTPFSSFSALSDSSIPHLPSQDEKQPPVRQRELSVSSAIPSRSLRQPLSERAHKPRLYTGTFSTRASSLDFSVTSIPVDFVLPWASLPTAHDAFWGLPCPPPSEKGDNFEPEKKRRTRVKRSKRQPAAIENENTTPSLQGRTVETAH